MRLLQNEPRPYRKSIYVPDQSLGSLYGRIQMGMEPYRLMSFCLNEPQTKVPTSKRLCPQIAFPQLSVSEHCSGYNWILLNCLTKMLQGLNKALRHISTRTTFDVQEKSRESNLESIYLLKLNRFRSPINTLNGRLRINQDIYLFRSVPKVGVDIQFSQLRSLSELAAGEESRFANTWSIEGRYAPTRTWGFRVKWGNRKKQAR